MKTRLEKQARRGTPTAKPLREARGSAAIRRELANVQKEMKRAQQQNRHQLYGAQQALCWALNSASMSPSRAFAEVESSRTMELSHRQVRRLTPNPETL
jgi:cell division septum initiation protein DivIVA